MVLLRLAIKDSSIPKPILSEYLIPALNESDYLFSLVQDILELTKDEFN